MAERLQAELAVSCAVPCSRPALALTMRAHRKAQPASPQEKDGGGAAKRPGGRHQGPSPPKQPRTAAASVGSSLLARAFAKQQSVAADQQCPMCFGFFTARALVGHAASCGEVRNDERGSRGMDEGAAHNSRAAAAETFGEAVAAAGRLKPRVQADDGDGDGPPKSSVDPPAVRGPLDTFLLPPRHRRIPGMLRDGV